MDELYDKLSLYHDVIDKLKADTALQIANSRKVEDQEKKEQSVSGDGS